MSVTVNISFDDPLNFTFDSSIVEVSGGLRLKEIGVAGDFTEDCADDTGVVYNPQYAEFSGGVIRKVDKRPVNSVCGATFNIGINANWGADSFGDLSAGLNGTPVVVGDRLSCVGSHGIYYESSLIGNLAGDFVLKVKYTPNYSTGPAQNVNIISLSNNVDGADDRIAIFNSPSGNNLRITAPGLSADTFGVWNPTAGQEYIFELFCSSNIITLFVDGVQIGGAKTVSPGRGITGTRVYLGAYPGVYNAADGAFDDLLVLSSGSQSVSYIVPDYAFIGSAADFPAFNYPGSNSLREFTAFAAIHSNAYFVMNGYYWNGASWSPSNKTFAEANTPVEIVNNLDTIPLDDSFIVTVVFEDGNSQDWVDSFLLSYSGLARSESNPSVLVNQSFMNEGLASFIETAVKTGTDEIKYTLSKGNDFYWWSGSSWEIADGSYGQSNTAAEIAANIGLFNDGEVLSTQIKIFLHSGNGDTTPEIINLRIDYDFAGGTPDVIDKCIVWWYMVDMAGIPVDDIIAVTLNKESVQYKTGTTVQSDKIEITPDQETGYCEIELIETENMEEGAKYIFDFGKETFERSVPNEATKNFWDLIV